jgi:polyhydroxyalkanoate synthesis regulator phasin
MSTPSLGLIYGTDEIANQNLRRLDRAIQGAPSQDDLAALRATVAALEARVAALEAAS